MIVCSNCVVTQVQLIKKNFFYCFPGSIGAKNDSEWCSERDHHTLVFSRCIAPDTFKVFLIMWGDNNIHSTLNEELFNHRHACSTASTFLVSIVGCDISTRRVHVGMQC